VTPGAKLKADEYVRTQIFSGADALAVRLRASFPVILESRLSIGVCCGSPSARSGGGRGSIFLARIKGAAVLSALADISGAGTWAGGARYVRCMMPIESAD